MIPEPFYTEDLSKCKYTDSASKLQPVQSSDGSPFEYKTEVIMKRHHFAPTSSFGPLLSCNDRHLNWPILQDGLVLLAVSAYDGRTRIEPYSLGGLSHYYMKAGQSSDWRYSDPVVSRSLEGVEFTSSFLAVLTLRLSAPINNWEIRINLTRTQL